MAVTPKYADGRINLDSPRWQQDTYLGRAKHFLTVTDPRNILATNEQLEAAKKLVKEYRLGIEPVHTTDEQVWTAKKLYDSAYHPDTGEKQIIIGRMSANVPTNLAIIGGMMTFYKSTPAIVFWQWVNQSLNATINYTNRSGATPIPKSTLVQAYVSATGAAVGVGLGLNAMAKYLPTIASRFVPFAAVASANCVNIPLMRQSELQNGVPVTNKDGEVIGNSVTAARRAIVMTVMSRVTMVIPVMVIPPIIMNNLEKKRFLKVRPRLAAPLQVGIIGAIMVCVIPLCCAIFPQKSSIRVTSLEPELQERILKSGKTTDYVYFNKGL